MTSRASKSCERDLVGAPEIRESCQGQIAYYKIPEHVRFVEEFPATLSGKIQKHKMREFEIEARGLEDVAKTATA